MGRGKHRLHTKKQENEMNRSKRINTFLIFVLSCYLLLIHYSCKKENANALQCDYKNLDADSILYSNCVSIIIKQNCLYCHNNSVKKGWVNLQGYAHVKKYADNHKLLGSIGHLKGYKAMPMAADMLSGEDICKIKFWVYNGAINK
jgi:hypothetical protein